MNHPAHHTGPRATHEKHHAPGLPEVTDEAGNTPGWVPALGAGVFAVLAMLIAVSVMMRDAAPPAPPPAAPAGEAVAAAPAADAPTPAPAPVPTPTQAAE